MKDKIFFSFSEKGFVMASLFVAAVAGYYMPVGVAWKLAAGMAVFGSLLAGWMVVENAIQNGMGRDIWGCVIFTTILSVSWFGYSQGAVSGHKILSAIAGGGLAIIIIAGIEPAVELIFERGGEL